MPVARRRKTKTPEEVPGAGDPDRKRVLNILANRRYRQRQREKYAALQSRDESTSSSQSDSQESHVQGLEEFLKPASITSSQTQPCGLVEEIPRDSDNLFFPEMNFGQSYLEISLFDDSNICHLPNTNPPLTHPQSPSSLRSPPAFTFPLSSDINIQVPVLNTIRAFSQIATALDVVKVAWDLTYLHVLPSATIPNLPSNLQPTPAQLTIPHHPILDALPWPSVREKLIYMLSLPSMYRPPIAQEDGDDCGTGQITAIQRLAHDMDDLREGFRVHGNAVGWVNCSELVDDAWEMGETFYRNWWFCIEPRVVVTTNRRRRERGLRALRLED
ncbi:hypothetical protein DM02DRAFT_727806 [Periconia macrospinosa]|uniref:BZIP domain-containing protein n=1 Tax=Periconia macrospinosa TaxID=97972 RepID=A0A2V1DU77_9PLEO|nr:hypothetical protein DM02DRAFT_727806 [Periconia macrospinosa]